MLPTLHLTPSRAAEKIKEIRASKDGTSKYNIARAAVLARIASPAKIDPPAPAYYSISPSGNPTSTIGEWKPAGKSLEEQLAEVERNPDLHSHDGPKRKPLVAKRAKIKAAIGARAGR